MSSDQHNFQVWVKCPQVDYFTAEQEWIPITDPFLKLRIAQRIGLYLCQQWKICMLDDEGNVVDVYDSGRLRDEAL